MYYPIALLAHQFLEDTATQLTYHGLYELNKSVDEGEFCVFFRNNHFNTMLKRKVKLGMMYMYIHVQNFKMVLLY